MSWPELLSYIPMEATNSWTCLHQGVSKLGMIGNVAFGLCYSKNTLRHFCLLAGFDYVVAKSLGMTVPRRWSTLDRFYWRVGSLQKRRVLFIYRKYRCTGLTLVNTWFNQTLLKSSRFLISNNQTDLDVLPTVDSFQYSHKSIYQCNKPRHGFLSLLIPILIYYGK